MSKNFTHKAVVKISGAALSEMAEGQCVSSPQCRIQKSKGVLWAFHVYGGKPNKNARVFLSVTDDYVFAEGTVDISNVKKHDFSLNRNSGSNRKKVRIVDEIDTSSLGEDGFIAVQVTFSNFNEGYHPVPSTVLDFITDSPHYTTDARIQVDGNVINVHRYFLSMISPVFHAEFTHDTKEAKSGISKITDFSFQTVKNVIDYCYGHEVRIDNLSDVTDILLFADKYDIKTVIAKFEPYFKSEMCFENFGVIVKYAWKLDKKEVKKDCISFYRFNHGNITLTPRFLSLDPATKLEIIDSAALLE